MVGQKRIFPLLFWCCWIRDPGWIKIRIRNTALPDSFLVHGRTNKRCLIYNGAQLKDFCALNATLLIDCKYPLSTLRGENWPKTIHLCVPQLSYRNGRISRVTDPH